GQVTLLRGKEMPAEKMPGDAKPFQHILGRRLARLRADEKRRQTKEAVPPRFARRAADRRAASRRDIDESLARAGRGALAEIEPEAKLLKQAKLPAHIDGGPDIRILHRIEQKLEALIERGMRLPLGNDARHRA